VGRATLKFNSPEIKAAFEYFQKIAFTEGNVRGGTKAIVCDQLPDRRQRAVRRPPGCYLFKQATFIAGKGGFPDSSWPRLTPRSASCAFPAKEAGNNPVLTGGDLARRSTTTPTPSSCATSSPARTTASRSARPATSRRTRPSTSSLYPSKMLQTIAKDVLYKSTAARFDGSDLMPAKVGAGTFWTEPIKWINGSQDLDTTLSNIDASWPKSAS
jgi:alpha-glucoside transport system substrate-binding protein